jgi:hypothetical protein
MGVKLSDLTTETAPASNDIILIADPVSGVAKKLTVSALKTLLDGLGGGTDTTAPTIVSAVANTANTIQFVFSEVVTVTTAGWSFKLNGSNWAVSSLSGSGNTWTFTMGTSAASTDTILRSYSSSTGNTVDTSSNELATFTDSAVTNSIPAGGSFDADALAFFNAAVITDGTQKNAVNTFVVAAKNNGYWSKLQVVLPFVGGTATKHAYDLKSATSKVTWTGSLVHDANGTEADVVAAPSTATGYGIIAFGMNNLTTNSHSMHFYRRDNADYGNQWVMGTSSATGDNYYIMQTRNSNEHKAYSGDSTNSLISVTGTDSRGLFSMSRTANNVFKLFRNGSQIGTTNTATNSKSNLTQNFGLFGHVQDGSINQNTPAKCGFAAIADGLSDAEISNLYTDVQAMQTTLSRNV